MIYINTGRRHEIVPICLALKLSTLNAPRYIRSQHILHMCKGHSQSCFSCRVFGDAAESYGVRKRLVRRAFFSSPRRIISYSLQSFLTKVPKDLLMNLKKMPKI